ncbi:unnamed protein product [Oppiella nova]|uniref:Uncharacterized protein n=1 Tax=Oppiella nova TaxID=334625 RepID=A0A7R9QS31_9ACAR|nr:unnamed protein product [Oppiella nova]CAG2173622.1 unnamed protein product [Oppiella nova]
MNEWLNLKMISLANNNIKRLNRVWFPPVLENLWSLDLSYNSIIEIPKDFFTGMPALRKLRLDNNFMKTLHDWWLGPVWNHLHEFWIDKNNMTCNPDLSWIPNATHPTFFDEGMCCSPRKQIMRYFHELRNLDEDITPLEPQSPYKSVNN